MVPIASFRNYDYFSNCGSVFSLHIKWQILSFFYWVAPNFYDVFLILLTPPFINYHHLSVFSVSKKSWKFLSPRLRLSIFWNWEYWQVMIIDERWQPGSYRCCSCCSAAPKILLIIRTCCSAAPIIQFLRSIEIFFVHFAHKFIDFVLIKLHHQCRNYNYRAGGSYIVFIYK